MRKLRKVSKKADIAITLLVFLIVVLCFFCLGIYAFNKVGKFKGIGLEKKEISTFYLERQGLEFYFYNLLLEVRKENPAATADELRQKFQEAFLAQEKEIKGISGVEFFYSPELVTQIKENSKYEINIEDNYVFFKIKEFNFSRDFGEKINLGVRRINHIKDIILEINT